MTPWEPWELFLARRPAKCHPPASGDALEEGTGIEDPPGVLGPGSIGVGTPAAKLPGDDPEGEKPAPPGRPSVSRESVRSGEEEPPLSAKIAKGSDGEEENAAAAALDSGPELAGTRRSSRSTPSATAATGERREAGPANASGRASGDGEPGPASARGPAAEACGTASSFPSPFAFPSPFPSPNPNMGAGRGEAAAGGDAAASGRSPRDPFDPARGPPRDDPPGPDPDPAKKRDAPGDGDEDDAPKVPAKTRSLSDRGDELGAGDSGGRECACAE